MDAEGERALVERARAGDSDAWATLHRSVYARLLAFAAHHAGSEVAEDMVSETMSRAVASISRFQWQGGTGFNAWLFTILRRVCVDHHRGRGRRRQLPAWRDVDQGADVGEAAERRQEHAQVRKVFGQLAPFEQEVLELRVLAGLTAEEAGVVLGKRAGAVRTAQSRALAHLRVLLEADAAPDAPAPPRGGGA